MSDDSRISAKAQEEALYRLSRRNRKGVSLDRRIHRLADVVEAQIDDDEAQLVFGALPEDDQREVVLVLFERRRAARSLFWLSILMVVVVLVIMSWIGGDTYWPMFIAGAGGGLFALTRFIRWRTSDHRVLRLHFTS
ncbi:hypothetical protein [Microbacterium sp. 179-I 3D4 NHS]|uniref:hypothetical protein n=1 Tax=Microbacterium sp. 179-I 3D4 NHS TaxID=3142381 RepID=UPI0039A22733